MTSFHIPLSEVLELNDRSSAVSLCKWKSTWTNYTLAMKLVVKDKEMQVATLLCAIGKEPDKVHACPHISMD
jgi:hypothetical protein